MDRMRVVVVGSANVDVSVLDPALPLDATR